jgi:hypothetical protein
MAWQGFMFGVQHLFRDKGYSTLSIKSGESIASGDYLSFVLDERRALMTFGANAIGHYVAADCTSAPDIDRLVVPSGHNFSGHPFKVQDDLFVGFPHADDLHSTASAGSGLIDVAVTAPNEPFVRVFFPTDSWNPQIPELWLTKRLVPGEGPDFKWRKSRIYNSESLIAPSGERGDVQHGVSQLVYELEYPYVDAAADIVILDQLVDDVEMDQAFLMWPPFDDEDVMICKMARDPERVFAHSAPNSGSGEEAYSYRFSIIEQTG